MDLSHKFLSSMYINILHLQSFESNMYINIPHLQSFGSISQVLPISNISNSTFSISKFLFEMKYKFCDKMYLFTVMFIICTTYGLHIDRTSFSKKSYTMYPAMNKTYWTPWELFVVLQQWWCYIHLSPISLIKMIELWGKISYLYTAKKLFPRR